MIHFEILITIISFNKYEKNNYNWKYNYILVFIPMGISELRFYMGHMGNWIWGTINFAIWN